MKARSRAALLCSIIAFVLLIVPHMAFFAYGAYNTVYNNNTMNVVVSSSDGSCNFRSGPGLTYNVIQSIYNGTNLQITAVYENSEDGYVWGQTSYGGYSGWISIRLTTVNSIENSSKASYDVTVTTPEYISLKTGPGAEFTQLYKPVLGQVLRIDETVANSFDGRPWGKTTVNGYTGWVSLDWTSRNASWTYNSTKDIVYSNNIYNATVSSTDGFLNLRSGPGLAYSVIQPIYNGNSLRVTAAMDNSSDGLVWGQTIYNGISGWICMEPTMIVSMETSSKAQYSVQVEQSENIVLRTGPGAEYPALVYTIPNNTTLFITETMINSFDGRPWGKTNYNGYSGWISLDWTYRAPGT